MTQPPRQTFRHKTPATAPWQPTAVATQDLAALAAALREVSSTVVVAGAGMSTDSGIPDYRGPGAQRATPMLYSEFVGDLENRRRYWARAFQGFKHMGRSEPNAGHRALVAWERTGRPTRLVGVISQNVDGLHEAAGQTRLIDLHGRGSDVICLSCRSLYSRAEVQEWLARANPDAVDRPLLGHAELRPDGDAVVEDWSDFVLVDCPRCGGILKPDVVFFGESAHPERVAQATAWVEEAESLLVAGSSLTVMSGLRFVRQAARRGIPVLVVNRGATRADELADVRLDAGVSEVLSHLVQA